MILLPKDKYIASSYITYHIYSMHARTRGWTHGGES
jgi:hypothetical protein